MKRKKPTMNLYNDELYKKQYEFQPNNNWQLPENVFHEKHWNIQSLQAKKAELNTTKERLNSFDIAAWSLHTKKRDPSTLIIKTIRKRYDPELLTQAWCKFYECLSRYDLIHPDAVKQGELNSLHLCEAPGGFISALNHFLKTKYLNMNLNWHASTLNPSYEGNPIDRMIPDDRLIIHTQDRWLFGADNTGDLLKYYNYKWLVDEITKRCDKKIHLVTADGSVDCIKDPGNQEANVEHLHYCEVITALSVLIEGGNFVLKIFTTFEHSTISLLYLLNCVFNQVSIIKPITSKGGNSETYVICQNFKGLQKLSKIWLNLLKNFEEAENEKSLFSLNEIPDDFLFQVEKSSEYFMRHQINTIQENIHNFGNDSKVYSCMLFKYHIRLVNKFLSLYTIFPIQLEQQIVSHKMRVPKIFTQSLFRCTRSFLFYKTDNIDVKLRFEFGKRIDNVLYSKFAPIDFKTSIKMLEKSNIFHSKSLFNQCKKKLRNCPFMNCSDRELNVNSSVLSNFWKFVSENASGNCLIIINLNLLCNFTVGLVFILSQAYTVYFFKYGVVYLVPYGTIGDNERFERMRDMLKKVMEVIVPKWDEFDNDLLELFDFAEYDYKFLECVHFYNSFLC